MEGLYGKGCVFSCEGGFINLRVGAIIMKDGRQRLRYI